MLIWILPVPMALSMYGVVLVVSGGVYSLALRAMHRPVQTGVESLLHGTGSVTGMRGGRYQVSVRSENWTAASADRLQPGDRVEVVSTHEPGRWCDASMADTPCHARYL